MNKPQTTTDGELPDDGLWNGPAPKPIDPKTGQHGAYYVLTEEERSKGFVRPVRSTYKHKTCGAVTSAPLPIAETFARQPDFYGATFCIRCRDHLPVGEFVWEGTKVVVGT